MFVYTSQSGLHVCKETNKQAYKQHTQSLAPSDFIRLLIGAQKISVTDKGVLYWLLLGILSPTLGGKPYFCSHFIDKVTEVLPEAQDQPQLLRSHWEAGVPRNSGVSVTIFVLWNVCVQCWPHILIPDDPPPHPPPPTWLSLLGLLRSPCQSSGNTGSD